MSGSDTVSRVVQEHQQRLTHYAVRILGNQATAADVVQESFARLQEELFRNGEPQNLRAWLYRVVRNLSIDHFRRTVRFTTLDDSDWMTQVANDPSYLAQKKEENAMVLESLDQLPPRQREVVRLKFQEGLTYAEIGQITDQSITTVGWLLHKAIATLREKLVTVQ